MRAQIPVLHWPRVRVETMGMHFSKDLMKWSASVLLALLALAQPLAAQTVEQWQRSAVQKYPALAQAGSPLNQRFIAIVTAKRQAEPALSLIHI